MLSWTGRFLTSSIGKKTFMALTGLGLVGFLVVHLAGNLTLYASNEAFNAYAETLESYGILLNIAEVGLLGLFAVHIAVALRLSNENKNARPTAYQVRNSMGRKSIGSSSMLITGLIIGAFVVIHVIDFRIAKLTGDIDDLALAVRERLGSPVGASIYLVGIIALGVHLSHAIQSAFQTLGGNHPKWSPILQGAARGLAAILTLGFASFPVILLLGGSN